MHTRQESIEWHMGLHVVTSVQQIVLQENKSHSSNKTRLEKAHSAQKDLAKDVYEARLPREIMASGAQVNQHAMTAGIKNACSYRSAPFSKDQTHGPPDDSDGHAKELWTFKYQRPQYARKRCPDLMVSAPSDRMSQVSGQPPKHRPVRAYEASVGSTTTYQQHTSSKS